MTVKELIEKLYEFPADAQVAGVWDGCAWNIETIEREHGYVLIDVSNWIMCGRDQLGDYKPGEKLTP